MGTNNVQSGQRGTQDQTEVALSASQINTWNQCQRKWGWSYINQMKYPTAGSALLGVKTHKQLENYLLSDPKEVFQFDFTEPAGEIAISGLEHLPKPGTPGMKIERFFKVVRQVGDVRIVYRGYKDVEIAPPSFPPVPMVLDHKTKSNISYALTEAQMAEDVQCNIYAYEAMQEYGSEACDLKWVNYQTRGAKKSKAVHLRVFKDDVEQRMRAIDQTSLAILHAKSTCKDASELPANLSECDAYGGCPFRDHCHGTVSANDRLDQIFGVPQEDADMGMTDDVINAMLNGINPPEGKNNPAPEGPKTLDSLKEIVAKEKASTSSAEDLMASLMGTSTPAPAPEPVAEEPKAKKGRKAKVETKAEPVTEPDAMNELSQLMQTSGEYKLVGDAVTASAVEVKLPEPPAHEPSVWSAGGAMELSLEARRVAALESIARSFAAMVGGAS